MSTQSRRSVLSAVAASVATGAVLVAFDATAATSQPPANLQSIDRHIKVLEAELARQEKRTARILDNTERTHDMVRVVFVRQGKSNIQFGGGPYNLIQRIYCAVEDLPSCPALP